MLKEVDAISYNESDVGKKVKTSKRKYTWEFSLSGVKHVLEVFVSGWSGKFKIYLNNKFNQKGQRRPGSSSSYAIELVNSPHRLLLVQLDNIFDLKVDKQSFKRLLYKAKSRKKNASTQETYNAPDTAANPVGREEFAYDPEVQVEVSAMLAPSFEEQEQRQERPKAVTPKGRGRKVTIESSHVDNPQPKSSKLGRQQSEKLKSLDLKGEVEELKKERLKKRSIDEDPRSRLSTIQHRKSSDDTTSFYKVYATLPNEETKLVQEHPDSPQISKKLSRKRTLKLKEPPQPVAKSYVPNIFKDPTTPRSLNRVQFKANQEKPNPIMLSYFSALLDGKP